MHIDFTLGLQKIGGLSRRKTDPGQIDEILNKVVDEFILNAVRYEPDGEHFHRVQVDVDKVRTLLVRDYVADVNQVTSFTDNTRKGVANFPADYSYLISDKLGLKKDCTDTPVTYENISERIYTASIEDSVIGGGFTKYFENFNLRLVTPNVSLVDVEADTIQNLAADIYTGYTAQTDKIFAINLMWELFQEKKRAGTYASDIKGLYWERYGRYYYPNQFILVTTASYTNLTVDNNAASFPYTIRQTLTQSRADATSEIFRTSRLARASAIDVILDTPFLKPVPKSPVSLIADNEFQIYTPENIIVTEAVLTYIRKPSRIDVSLQRNCELPAEFHSEIVERAIQYYAGKIEQIPLYQVQKDLTDK